MTNFRASPPPLTATPLQLSYAGLGGSPGKPRRHDVYMMAAALAVLLAGMAFVIFFLAVAQPLVNTGAGSVYVSVAPSEASVLVFRGAAWLALIVAAGCTIYWLVWVWIVHREMQVFAGGQYPISPAQALGFCFIPLFNLFWMVWMPYRLARDLEFRLDPRHVRPGRVLTCQILALVPGGCLWGLGSFFRGIAMNSIQSSLNELWRRYRPAVPNAEPDDAAARLAAMQQLIVESTQESSEGV